jgi:4-hydroxybenzoate polyprenyltransferase
MRSDRHSAAHAEPLPAPTSPPLAVDLDGTLVKTDLLIESVFILLKRNSLYFFLFPFWLLRGRAFFKRQISIRVALDASALPYREGVVDFLKAEHDRGRRLVLATAADEEIAQQVADHLGLFDAVLASDGKVNLLGRAKRDRLVAQFGLRGFDYAGNDRRDLVVWSSAQKAILVSSSRRLVRSAERLTEVERVFDGRERRTRSFVRALRPGQWVKNLLVFVPLAAAGNLPEVDLLVRAFLAFFAFSFCASCVYVVNDLADLDADRRHPHKRQRPLAAGEFPLLWMVLSVPLLLGLALLFGWPLPRSFDMTLMVYFLLNLGYSFTLKRIVLLDVVVLAGLYTMRIMAGSASVNVWPSSWLLAFSTFLFLSLALVKRYAELAMVRVTRGDSAEVRGYRVIDMELLAALGGGSGYVAVLVLAIYISSGAAELIYARHMLMWLLCPLLLYWISYVWLITHRGRMRDDPVVFTIRDRASQVVAILSAIVFLVSK